MNQNISIACTSTRLFIRRVEVAVYAEAISVVRKWKFYEISRKVYLYMDQT